VLRPGGRLATDEMFDAFTLPLGLIQEDRDRLRPVFDRLLAEGGGTAPAAQVKPRCVLYARRRPD
jgi:hypothetical protein